MIDGMIDGVNVVLDVCIVLYCRMGWVVQSPRN